MADWEEIKRLAIDLNRVQLSSTLHKLSEPNCIEIVNLLVEQQRISVIYTLNGKEYITPEHFLRQVQDELEAQNGRAQAAQIAAELNVDVSRVQLVAQRLADESPDRFHYVLGQLLADSYLQRIAAEINETLEQNGQVSVFELASNRYDLPSDFLQTHVLDRFLGTLILARQDAEDRSRYFTQKYIARCKARLRGATSALTMPTPVAVIFSRLGVQDALYHQLLAELQMPGVVTSRQKGALYVPHIYARTQKDWVLSSYAQNGYLEYDAVERLGVSGAQAFVKRLLADSDCTYLRRCCVDRRLVEQLDASLDECIATGSYMDAKTVLPGCLDDEDVADLLQRLLTAGKRAATQLFGTTVVTQKFIGELVEPCNAMALANAKHAVESGRFGQQLIDAQLSAINRGGQPQQQDVEDSKADRKEQRRNKAAGGKGGGGTQGRETKTRSTKKHQRAGRNNAQSSDEDDDGSVQVKQGKAAAGVGRLVLVTAGDIETIIAPKLEEEGLDELGAPIARHFVGQFERIAQESARSLHAASTQNATQDRRQTHAALQDKLNGTLVDVRLYEKGLRLLPAGQHSALVRYLLKTLCTDVSNELHAYALAESRGTVLGEDVEWTTESRAKIIQECSAEYKSALTALNKTLTGESVEEFLQAAETALQACSMILKKADKKKDRTLVMCHKHGLLDKLASCNDPALVLHLTVLVLFTVATQNIVHASGKHVAALLSFLHASLSPEQNNVLKQYRDLVFRLLSNADREESDETRATLDEINGLVPQLKEIAVTYKRPTSTAAGGVE